MVALFATALVSCDNATTTAEVSNDSIAVDTVQVDSVAVDSLTVDSVK